MSGGLRLITKDNTFSLCIQFKGILHRIQWRRRVDDGGGSRAGKNIGHTPNTFFNILVALLRQSLVDLKWHVGCVWDSLCDNLLNSMWDSIWDGVR